MAEFELECPFCSAPLDSEAQAIMSGGVPPDYEPSNKGISAALRLAEIFRAIEGGKMPSPEEVLQLQNVIERELRQAGVKS